jgi:hypothetical protein
MPDSFPDRNVFAESDSEDDTAFARIIENLAGIPAGRGLCWESAGKTR